MFHRFGHIFALLLLGVLIGCSGSFQAPEESGRHESAPAGAATRRPALPATSQVPTPTVRTLSATSDVATPTRTVVPTSLPSFSPTALPSLTPSPPLDLALVGGTLIDGSSAAAMVDAVVTIRGDRIVAVGRRNEVTIPPNTPIHDVRGMTILPGIINAHAHTDTLTDDDLKQWTRAGITTIRDLGGPQDMLLMRRATLAATSDPALPRLLVAGPFVTVPGGHPIPVYGLTNEIMTVQGPEDARAKITALLDAGVDVVKIAVSGRTDVAWPELSNEEIRAIVETAHGRNVRVAAHIDRAVALRRAVEQGVDDAAHMPRDRIPDDVIMQMVERDMVLIPTIAVYEALADERGQGAAWRRTALPIMQDNLRRFVAAGGTLALGDDYGNPGVALGMPLAEMQQWLEAGVDPLQVLVAATHGSAVACGLEDQVGLVRPGMIADLLVVAGDPLVDIAVLEQVALVVHNGAVIPR